MLSYISREFHNWLDWETAINKSIHSRATAVNAQVAELDAVHASVIYQPLKSKDRMESKVKEEYHGHLRQVKDIVRGSIVCESDKDIANLLSFIADITNTYIPLEMKSCDASASQSHGQRSTASHNNAAKSAVEQGDYGIIVNDSKDADDAGSIGAASRSEHSVQSVAPTTTGSQFEQITKQRNREIAKGLRVVSVKNRFKSPLAHGYRDILITFAVDYIHSPEIQHGAAFTGVQESVLERAQCLCELQIHHADLLFFANSMSSWDFYAFFRTFFMDDIVAPMSSSVSDTTSTATSAMQKGSSGTKPSGGGRLGADAATSFQNKLKALKTMDQVGEFVEQLEAAMQVYLGGVGRVGKDLPRLSAYFQLFMRVGEVELAEAMQSSIIQQLRDQGRQAELYQELSALAKYFKHLKRYKHAKPLSEEALELCEVLLGSEHLETAHQLTNHANLLYCCDELSAALPLFERALLLKKKLLGDLDPITYRALDQLASVHYDTGNYSISKTLYKEVLETHRKIARNSRTGQPGPEVAAALINLARIHEVDPSLRDFDLCYKYYDEVLIIYEDFYGAEHETRAVCWEMIANLKDQEGLLAEALALHRAALDLRWCLFKKACEYTGFAEDDFENNPPWPQIADSLNSVAELLLDLGEIEEATALLRRAVHMRNILVQPRYHPLSNGTENAMMALASVQTNLAYALIQGEKYPGHHLVYYEARDIIKPAYAIRMKYLGVRAVQTEQTLNVQGLVEELIADYNAEKEKIKLERKHTLEKEQKAAAKRALKDAKLMNEANASTSSMQAIAKTPLSNAEQSSQMPGNVNASALQTSSPQRNQGSFPSGANSESKTSMAGLANVDKTSVNNVAGGPPSMPPVASAPRNLKISQKLTQDNLAPPLPEAIILAVPSEDTDELQNHVHSRGINDIGARQQLDAPVAKAHELLETAERLRDLGEYDSALKCCNEALFHLRPDLYCGSPQKQTHQESAEGEGDSVVSLTDYQRYALPMPTATASHIRGPERKLAFAIALSCLGTCQMDKGWFNLAVQSFQQSLDLIILTYGDSYVHRDIAQGLSALAFALRSAGHSDKAIEVAMHARTQWISLIKRETLKTFLAKDSPARSVKSIVDLGPEGAESVGSLGQYGSLTEPSELTLVRFDSVDDDLPAREAAASHPHHELPSQATVLDPAVQYVAGETSSTLQNLTIDEKVYTTTPGLNDASHADSFDTAHPDASQVCKVDHVLVLSLLVLGRIEEAYQRCLACLAVLRKIHTDDQHPDIISLLNTRGYVEAHLGHYEAAYETFSENQKLRIRTYGSSDPAYALSMNNFGASLFMLDDLARAGRTWTESIELRERQVGLPSPAVSTALHNIAALFIRQENMNEAAPFAHGKAVIDDYLFQQFGEPLHLLSHGQ